MPDGDGPVAARFEERMRDEEERRLAPEAVRSYATRGRAEAEEECSLRTPFQRDRDRIIHAKAFRRLKHKTQVFIAPEGDHYRTRLTHTLEVVGIARSVARALQLNEDLTEAIALGHDLGHPPFGHAGEEALSDALEAATGRRFRHNEHSLRDRRAPGARRPRAEPDARGPGRHPEPHGADRAGDARGTDREARRPRRVHQPRHRRRDPRRRARRRSACRRTRWRCWEPPRRVESIDLCMILLKTRPQIRDILLTPRMSESLLTLRAFMFEEVYLRPDGDDERRRVRHVVSSLFGYFLGAEPEGPDARVPRDRPRGRHDGPLRAAHVSRAVRARGMGVPAMNAVGGRISQATIDAVRERADLVELVEARTGPGRPSRGQMMLRCPFHDERTPSFHVHPGDKLYKCFGCGEQGGLFDFVRKIENLDFPEAVEWLADRYGVEVEREDLSPGDRDRLRSRQARRRRCSTTSRRFYERSWSARRRARRPASTWPSAASSAESIARFRLGFAPSDWDRVARSALSKGYPTELLYEAGVSSQGRRGPIDRFRGRIIVPALRRPRPRARVRRAGDAGRRGPEVPEQPRVRDLQEEPHPVRAAPRAPRDRQEAPRDRGRGLHRRDRAARRRLRGVRRRDGHVADRGGRARAAAPGRRRAAVLRRRRGRPGGRAARHGDGRAQRPAGADRGAAGRARTRPTSWRAAPRPSRRRSPRRSRCWSSASAARSRSPRASEGPDAAYAACRSILAAAAPGPERDEQVRLRRRARCGSAPPPRRRSCPGRARRPARCPTARSRSSRTRSSAGRPTTACSPRSIVARIPRRRRATSRRSPRGCARDRGHRRRRARGAGGRCRERSHARRELRRRRRRTGRGARRVDEFPSRATYHRDR